MRKIIYITLVSLLAFLTLTSCVSDKGTEKEPEMKVEDIVDFVLEIEEEREIRILQLTDTQVIDAGQSRSEDRLKFCCHAKMGNKHNRVKLLQLYQGCHRNDKP